MKLWLTAVLLHLSDPVTVGVLEMAEEARGPTAATVTGMASPTPLIPVTLAYGDTSRRREGPKHNTQGSP